MCRFTPRIRPRRRETTSTLAPAAFRARSGTISSTFSKPSAARTAILRPLSRRLVGTSSPVARWRSFPRSGALDQRAAELLMPGCLLSVSGVPTPDNGTRPWPLPRGGRAGDGGVTTWSRQGAQACEKPARHRFAGRRDDGVGGGRPIGPGSAGIEVDTHCQRVGRDRGGGLQAELSPAIATAEDPHARLGIVVVEDVRRSGLPPR